MYVNILYHGRPIWRTVTICHHIPFKNTFAVILMYFVNTTLKFSAILDGRHYNITPIVQKAMRTQED